LLVAVKIFNVVAIVSSDPFLQGEAVREFVRTIPNDPQRIDFDGETAKLADVLDEVRSPSMFGGLRVAVVRDANDFITKFREQLEDYCAAPSDAGILVLRCDSLPKTQRIYKAIDKIGKIIDVAPPKQFELQNWIIVRAKSHHQAQITPDAARSLAEMIGADLGKLDSELGKLALQTTTGRIEAQHVLSVVVFQREQQMWDMTDQLTAAKPDEAVRRWRHLVQTDPSSEFRAVTWLALWVEKAARALSLRKMRVPSSEIAKELKIWPAQNVDRLIATAERVGETRLLAAVDQLVELDRSIKSSGTDVAASVERFLATIVKKA